MDARQVRLRPGVEGEPRQLAEDRRLRALLEGGAGGRQADVGGPRQQLEAEHAQEQAQQQRRWRSRSGWATPPRRKAPRECRPSRTPRTRTRGRRRRHPHRAARPLTAAAANQLSHLAGHAPAAPASTNPDTPEEAPEKEGPLRMSDQAPPRRTRLGLPAPPGRPAPRNSRRTPTGRNATRTCSRSTPAPPGGGRATQLESGRSPRSPPRTRTLGARHSKPWDTNCPRKRNEFEPAEYEDPYEPSAPTSTGVRERLDQQDEQEQQARIDEMIVDNAREHDGTGPRRREGSQARPELLPASPTPSPRSPSPGSRRSST